MRLLLRSCLLFTGVLAGWLVIAESAMATQVHSQPEGLYVHQMAHIFFLVSMWSLEFWLRQRNLTKEKGWKYIQLAAVLFIIWNIDAAAVHFMESHLDTLGISSPDIWHLQFENFHSQKSIAILYYILKMDHLLCVPAMFFLYFGLKKILTSTVVVNEEPVKS